MKPGSPALSPSTPSAPVTAKPQTDGGVVAHWFQRCEAFARSEGMPSFLFGLSLPRAGRTSVEFLITNYPAPWLRRYDACDYIRVDPVAARMLSAVRPFAWDELHGQGGARAAAFWKQAQRHRLSHGYTIPLHGARGQRAAFALSGTDTPLPAEGRSDRFARAWSFAVDLFDEMQRQYERPVPADRCLTRQQREALSLVARGLSVRAIADTLARHPRTVEYHLHGALQRLGTASREQAIVHALLGGEIEVTRLPRKLRDWYRHGRPEG